MNNIEKLLQKLCPNGVQWKALGEVIEVKKSRQINKTELKEEGKYPAYNGGVSYSGFTDKYNVEENTTIISQGGASATLYKRLCNSIQIKIFYKERIKIWMMLKQKKVA